MNLTFFYFMIYDYSQQKIRFLNYWFELSINNNIILNMNSINKQTKYEKALEYEIFVKGEYSFSKEEIQNADCIFDIWWHKWLFAKRCRTQNSKARIHYFEPIKEFYKQANLALWNDKNIIFNNYWISAKSWEWIILLNQEKTMQSSKYTSFLNPKWTIIDVKFITLKEYIKHNQINKIDVLKMDIEWMEFEVLSSRTNFELGKINNLIVEIHLLNEKMKQERNEILIKIKNTFLDIKTIKSEYCNDIFLLRAKK